VVVAEVRNQTATDTDTNRGRLTDGLSTNTQFALGVHMLTLMAFSEPEPLCSDAMAASAKANPVHVRRVLGRFRAAGLVASKCGVGGGSHLLQDPATITLADVWRIVQGEHHVLDSYAGDPECPVGRSIQPLLIDFDRRARRALEDELATTTISQLASQAVAYAEGHAVAWAGRPRELSAMSSDAVAIQITPGHV
jgi:DNA-binding IscR family transcriptional regulator